MPEAAQALGLTVDGVRSRIKRDKIAHEHEGGRVYVLLDADQARAGHDQASDQGARQTEDRTAELIATLREQLQAERAAHSEARRLLAAALERIPPQLEPPADSAPDAPQTPEPGEEQQGRGPAPSEPQAAT